MLAFFVTVLYSLFWIQYIRGIRLSKFQYVFKG